MKQVSSKLFPRLQLIITTVVLVLASARLCIARDNITSNRPLLDNQTLISSNGRFALGFFTAGDFNRRYLGLWYNNISVQTILWVANRDNPLTNSKGSLSLSKDGFLTIYDQNSTSVWHVDLFPAFPVFDSFVDRPTAPSVRLFDTGNFAVSLGGDYPFTYGWQSFYYPTDTLLPAMKLGIQFNLGYSWNLTSWSSSSNPSPGKKMLWMDTSGYPEIYLSDTNLKKWRRGPWDETQFVWSIGGPVSDVQKIQPFTNTTNTNDEISYSFFIESESPSRLVVTESGVVQHLLWENNQWKILWYEPKNSCDELGYCGHNTICNSQDKSVCSCLPEFVGNLPNGCTRKTKLNCDYADVFVNVSNIKLPEPSNSNVHKGLSFDDCQSLCLGNCACIAFAIINDGNAKCMTWSANVSDISRYNGTGQILYLRVSNENKGLPNQAKSLSNENKGLPNKLGKTIRLVAIIVGVIFGIIILSYVGCLLCRGKKINNAITSIKAKEIDGENDLELPLVDFEIITAATNNFSPENKLGEGGFGPVYKGKLEEDQEIAVKRLSKSSQQGVDEFKNEIQLIAKLQHRNLVRLLGCCIQREERMLIYEYMPNKSLDAFLFGKEEGALLEWDTRYNVITGIARGVLYLHHDSRLRIIHRDLKASNILLDKDMNPKISDFGMAIIFGGDQTDFNTRKVVGTYGYMSPEYALEGIFSMKSDIFSFGVLVLEIITGKKNRGVYAFSTHLNLLAHVWDLWKESDSLQLVDEKIASCAPTNEIIKCIKIGLLCVQERPENRPLMPSVIEMFSKDITLLPEPNAPGFVTRFAPLDTVNIQEQFSLNNVSTISLVGR